MSPFLTILGYIVGYGYLLKIFFQMYLKHKEGEKIEFGPNNTMAWEYWKPIKMVEGSKLNVLRGIFNFIHVLAIIYLGMLFISVLIIRK